MRWMDRWAARAQRKSDQRQARWLERQHEKGRSGRMTVTDRRAARAQRKSGERAARWQKMEALRKQVPRGPVAGPGGCHASIGVEQTGLGWTSRRNFGPIGGGGGTLMLAALLISLAIWWLVFRRSYTVHVRTDDRPPVKIHTRLPSEEAAYRVAAQLASQFQDLGPAALLSWRADVSASMESRGT